MIAVSTAIGLAATAFVLRALLARGGASLVDTEAPGASAATSATMPQARGR